MPHPPLGGVGIAQHLAVPLSHQPRQAATLHIGDALRHRGVGDRFFFKADGGVEECRGCRWRRNRLGVVGVGGTYVHESSRNVAHDNCNRVARNLLNIAPNTDFG
jgi:hypothetical protein